MTSKRRRAYEELRAHVDGQNGSMRHERAGWPSGGVWIVRLGDKERVFESNGRGYPELDALYVPNVPHPRHY